MAHRTPIQLKVDVVSPKPDVLHAAARALDAGLLVAYPTDTVYGLAADPGQRKAVDRVFQAKGRASDLAVPVIAATLDQVVASVGRMTPLARRLAGRFWPGPLTLVLDAAGELDRRLLGGRDSVAVRIPDHAVARGVAAALGRPITATSANRSGAPPALSADEVSAALGQEVHLILDGGRSSRGEPSTIVDARKALPALVREGVVPWERVLQSLS